MPKTGRFIKQIKNIAVLFQLEHCRLGDDRGVRYHFYLTITCVLFVWNSCVKPEILTYSTTKDSSNRFIKDKGFSVIPT